MGQITTAVYIPMCIGLLMIKCKQVYINGASEHFRQYYNFMDFAILGLYLASYALRFATYYRVTEASLYFTIVKKQVYNLWDKL